MYDILGGISRTNRKIEKWMQPRGCDSLDCIFYFDHNLCFLYSTKAISKRNIDIFGLAIILLRRKRCQRQRKRQQCWDIFAMHS